MNIPRLEELVRLLQAVAENPCKTQGFNLDNWYSMEPCGTTACAVGWAALHPPFIEEGFHLVHNGAAYIIGTTVEFRGVKAWNAVQAFFELTNIQSYYLFSSYSYEDSHNPLPVIKRLKTFLKVGHMKDSILREMNNVPN